MRNQSGPDSSPGGMNVFLKLPAADLPIYKLGILLFVFLLAGCSAVFRDSASKPAGATGRVVEVDPAHQVCELAGDCALAYVDCSNCDCGVPVNKDFIDLYSRLYIDLCSEYAGPACEVECPPVILTCQSGLCGGAPAE